MWGRGPIGISGACSTLCQFSVTPSATQNQTGPLWCCFPSVWGCARSRPLWVSPTNFPVRLGVSPTAISTLTGVFSLWFEALFPHAGTLGCVVCHPVHQLLPRRPTAALPTPLYNLLCHLSGSSHIAASPLSPAAHLHPSYRSG